MKPLFYCILWRDTDELPITKFVHADDAKALMNEFFEQGYAAVSVTDITNREVDTFDL